MKKPGKRLANRFEAHISPRGRVMDNALRLWSKMFTTKLGWCVIDHTGRLHDKWSRRRDSTTYFVATREGESRVEGMLRFLVPHRGKINDFMMFSALAYMTRKHPELREHVLANISLYVEGATFIIRGRDELPQRQRRKVRDLIFKVATRHARENGKRFVLMAIIPQLLHSMRSKGARFHLYYRSGPYYVAVLDLEETRKSILQKFGLNCPWFGWLPGEEVPLSAEQGGGSALQ